MPRAGGDYIWQSRVLDGLPGIAAGAVVGAVIDLSGGRRGRDGRDRGARRRGRRGGRRWPDRPAQGWDRVRPGRHRLVVHPVVVGADLRRDPQDRVLPAAGGAARLDRRRGLLRHLRGHAPRVDHRHRPDVRAGGARDGRLCPDPASVPVCRADRAGDHVRADARVVAGRLQGCLRSHLEFDVRGLRRVRPDHRRCSHQRPVRGLARAARPGR